ncbi:MAG: indole-3-glycerol phosphate synthase TrpC [Dehalococcoidales bacterium]|nr:indole-3-glycerol phosphate synthase TrpC [Dehalococcoidales bacterium]
MIVTILDTILTDKKIEVEQKKKLLPLAVLKERIAQYQPVDFAAALKGDDVMLIAEVKKASPSKGVLRADLDPVRLAEIYARNGAAAISVLTEVKYFQGSLKYLAAIREKVNLPLLRKDFIYEEYQVYESAAYGADAMLLIASILSPGQLGELLEISHGIGLFCLVEVHNEEELQKALLAGTGIIGINNRDLNTFKVDTDTTRRLRMLVPEENIVVSESGIHNSDDIKKMKECKVDAVLVGEALVTAADIPAKMRGLLS